MKKKSRPSYNNTANYLPNSFHPLKVKTMTKIMNYHFNGMISMRKFKKKFLQQPRRPFYKHHQKDLLSQFF